MGRPPNGTNQKNLSHDPTAGAEIPTVVLSTDGGPQITPSTGQTEIRDCLKPVLETIRAQAVFDAKADYAVECTAT